MKRKLKIVAPKIAPMVPLPEPITSQAELQAFVDDINRQLRARLPDSVSFTTTIKVTNNNRPPFWQRLALLARALWTRVRS